MMPDGDACALADHRDGAAVHAASSRHSSCGVEGSLRSTTRRHGWRAAASAAAGLSLAVIVACLAAAPERIRSYGADVLSAAGGKGGLQARGSATAGRLEALADAEAHDILSTATFAKNPQTDGVLAASLLKIQSSTWAEHEAHDLEASLASAIRNTDSTKVVRDALHNTGLARVEARRSAAVKAASQEEENRELYLFDTSAKQHEMESGDPHLFDKFVKEPEVESSNLHLFDTPSEQPEMEGLKNFHQKTPEQEFYEQHKQMFKAGHGPFVAARNTAPLQHPVHHQPKVQQLQHQFQQPSIQHTQRPQNVVAASAKSHDSAPVLHFAPAKMEGAFDWAEAALEKIQAQSGLKIVVPPSVPSVTVTGDGEAAVPASVVALFKEQEAKDAAQALKVEAARRQQPTGQAGQSLSDLTWPTDAVQQSSLVTDTRAQQHLSTDSPAEVRQVVSHKVHASAGAQNEHAFSIDSLARWRQQGAQGLVWPHALVRAAGASVQQGQARAQAKSVRANHHLSSQPKKKLSVREQLKRARMILNNQARAQGTPAGGDVKLISHVKGPSSASEVQMKRAREALFKQVGRSSVLLAKPHHLALAQVRAKLAVVQQGQKRRSDPPVTIVAPDVHAKAAPKAVRDALPTVLILPPDVHTAAAALIHKAARVAALKQSLGPQSLDEPPVTIVAPGGDGSTPAAADQAPAAFGNPQKGAEPVVVIVPPGATLPESVTSAPTVPAATGQIFITPPTPVASGGENTGEEGDAMRESDETFVDPLHHVPHVSSAQAVTNKIQSASAAADQHSADSANNDGDTNWRSNIQGQMVRAGATCAQNPAKVGGEGPRQCAVWAQPAWGHMKKLPVGSSPQVANGCIQYVCRSVRAEPQKFLDQRLGLLIESLTDHCLDGASYLSLQFNKMWSYSVRGLYNLWGQKLPDALETNDPSLNFKFVKGLKLVEVDDSAHRVDPETIPPGTIMGSMVYGCMYPFMNCKNQLYMARHLCQDDGYWIRGIHDFNCTGGFIASSTGDATKWKYVDHFALSAILLLGLVVLGIFARSYAISRNREMDRRFWWMHHITSKDEEDAQGKEIVQITL